MKQTTRALYQDINGKDYLLKLKEGSKRIIMLDLKSGYISELPFLSYKAALSNFKLWIVNSTIRLPLTFCINTEVYDTTFRMEGELNKLGLPFPEFIEDLKKYLVYHNGQYMIVDEFDNNNIPEVDLVFLKELNKAGVIQKRINLAKKIESGMFNKNLT